MQKVIKLLYIFVNDYEILFILTIQINMKNLNVVHHLRQSQYLDQPLPVSITFQKH